MTLAYNIDGSGDQVVLCVTGLGGHAKFWDRVRAGLANRFTILSFDQRGCGANADVAGEHTIAEIANDALDILDAAGVVEAFVIGHSMGGVVTQSIVLDHPARVKAVVFSGTFCVFDWYMETLGDLRQTLLNEVGSEPCEKLSAILAMPGGNVLDPRYGLKDRLDNATARAPDEVMLARMRAPYGFDRREELACIDVPTLVIGASDDLLAPLYQSQMIKDRVPHANLEVVDGGHFFPNTRPELYLSKVGAFLDALK